MRVLALHLVSRLGSGCDEASAVAAAGASIVFWSIWAGFSVVLSLTDGSAFDFSGLLAGSVAGSVFMCCGCVGVDGSAFGLREPFVGSFAVLVFGFMVFCMPDLVLVATWSCRRARCGIGGEMRGLHRPVCICGRRLEESLKLRPWY